ncbi:MAG: hypothetical protein GXP43_02750 [bacterium]|nr:hypothetical protein [bacterium]
MLNRLVERVIGRRIQLPETAPPLSQLSDDFLKLYWRGLCVPNQMYTHKYNGGSIWWLIQELPGNEFAPSSDWRVILVSGTEVLVDINGFNVLAYLQRREFLVNGRWRLKENALMVPFWAREGGKLIEGLHVLSGVRSRANPEALEVYAGVCYPDVFYGTAWWHKLGQLVMTISNPRVDLSKAARVNIDFLKAALGYLMV